MLKLILPLSLAFAAGAGVSHARADLLVQGSTFDLTLYSTADGGYSVTEPITVNGQPDQFVFGSVPVTVTEMDTPIGGGSETIAISVAATQDIFPSSVPGSDSFYLSIGLSSSPLQLSEPVTLTSALLTGTIPPPSPFPSSTSSSGISATRRPGTASFLGEENSVDLSIRPGTMSKL